MRAFIYIRVSTVDQEYSPEVQERQARAYCESKGYEVVAAFNESAVSGGMPFEKRPLGRELLARIGEVEAVVFSKLDRAFRDTVNCIVTVDALREARKVVHFLDLGVDTSTPAGQLCLEVMAAFAKFERARISERTREALAVARSRGVQLGRRENVLSFEEAVVARRARDLREAGESYEAIARALEREGHLTPAGKTNWTHVQAKRLIARSA